MNKVNSRRVATDLLNYYTRNRGVGHSNALRLGLEDAPTARVLAHNKEMASHLGVQHNRVISFAQVQQGHLLGKYFPLVIDNAALMDLLDGLLSSISHYELEAKRALDKNAVAQSQLESERESKENLEEAAQEVKDHLEHVLGCVSDGEPHFHATAALESINEALDEVQNES